MTDHDKPAHRMPFDWFGASMITFACLWLAVCGMQCKVDVHDNASNTHIRLRWNVTDNEPADNARANND